MNFALAAPSSVSARPPSDSLVARTLLAIARQRSGLDETRCRLVLDWLRTEAAIHAVLRKSLLSHGLTELKFSILVTLFAVDPDPMMPADLAHHAGVTRPTVADALDDLQRRHLVARARDPGDCRIINVRLTRRGRTAINAAVQHYLRTAGCLARFVQKTAQAAAAAVCANLRLGAGRAE